MEGDGGVEVKRGRSRKAILKSSTAIAILICIVVSSVYFMHGRHVPYRTANLKVKTSKHAKRLPRPLGPLPLPPVHVQRPRYPAAAPAAAPAPVGAGYRGRHISGRPYDDRVSDRRIGGPRFNRINPNGYNGRYDQRGRGGGRGGGRGRGRGGGGGGYDDYYDYGRSNNQRPYLDDYYNDYDDYDDRSDYQNRPVYGGYRRTGGNVNHIPRVDARLPKVRPQGGGSKEQRVGQRPYSDYDDYSAQIDDRLENERPYYSTDINDENDEYDDAEEKDSFDNDAATGGDDKDFYDDYDDDDRAGDDGGDGYDDDDDDGEENDDGNDDEEYDELADKYKHLLKVLENAEIPTTTDLPQSDDDHLDESTAISEYVTEIGTQSSTKPATMPMDTIAKPTTTTGIQKTSPDVFRRIFDTSDNGGDDDDDKEEEEEEEGEEEEEEEEGDNDEEENEQSVEEEAEEEANVEENYHQQQQHENQEQEQDQERHEKGEEDEPRASVNLNLNKNTETESFKKASDDQSMVTDNSDEQSLGEDSDVELSNKDVNNKIHDANDDHDTELDQDDDNNAKNNTNQENTVDKNNNEGNGTEVHPTNNKTSPATNPSIEHETEEENSEPDVNSMYKYHQKPMHFGNISPYPWDLEAKQPDNLKCVRTQTMFSKFQLCASTKDDDPESSEMLSGMGMWKSHYVQDVQLSVLEGTHTALIDVGAGIGVFSLAIAILGREVIAVEPCLTFIEKMQQSVIKNNVFSQIQMFRNVISNDPMTMVMSHQKGKMHFQPATTADEYDRDSVVDSITLNDLARVVSRQIKTAVLKVDIPGFVGEALAQSDDLFVEVDIVTVIVRWDKRDVNLCNFLVFFFREKGYRPFSHYISTPLNPKDALTWAEKYILWKKIKH